jgi:hypothetical protein
MVPPAIVIEVDCSPLTTLVPGIGKLMLPMLQCGMNITTIFSND